MTHKFKKVQNVYIIKSFWRAQSAYTAPQNVPSFMYHVQGKHNITATATGFSMRSTQSNRQLN